jgi:Zn-dependent protease
VPILTYVLHAAAQAGWKVTNYDAFVVLTWLWRINIGLLLFNLLPIYPLDGGQIVRALLWFPLGQIRSLFVAAGLGFVGCGALILVALWQRSIWIGIMALFLLSQAGAGWRHAQFLKAEAAAATVPIAPDNQATPERKAVF